MCKQYFTLADIVQIASREIGTGFIGGKSIGMLMATAIVSKSEETKEYFKDILEPHDSFYVGTDVFYSYIVENGLWDLRMKQKLMKDILNMQKNFKMDCKMENSQK